MIDPIRFESIDRFFFFSSSRTIQVMIAKEGVPSFYIKLLANLEDLLLATLKDKPAVKKMSATNTRSLNRMKLQLRKHNKGCVRPKTGLVLDLPKGGGGET